MLTILFSVFFSSKTDFVYMIVVPMRGVYLEDTKVNLINLLQLLSNFH
uniref:Uncharacterized protein n=1 Tax=Chondria sp. (in: red algae) TaxID=1982705 RepID=A0A1Z1MR77_9FLOR|nr:hypothetical protein [Chondria sp. (in: red algae)]